MDKKNSVLIVDDDVENIKLLSNILKPDYTILAARNGLDAVEAAEKHLPDVILLDIIMPVMDGYTAIAALKASEKTKDVPVIFITGLISPEEEEKGLILGAADYITKPFSPAVVSLRVRNQIKKLGRPAAGSDTDKKSDAALNRQGYLLLVDDDEIVQLQNKHLLMRAGYSLRQAHTLGEARAAIETAGLPRAVVLDVILPDGNGVDFLHELRKTSNVPVLMLTSRSMHKDILMALEAGGDYYLTKPYNSAVFLSYVETLLRRSSIVPDILSIGAIRLELASGKAFLNGEDMILSQKEFALLQQFIQHPHKTLLAKELYKKVWGQEMLPDDYSLSSAIYRLRKKMSGSGYTITAEYREGYVLESE